MKKFISWNVNGLRACMGKCFSESFQELNADIFCLQETKLQKGQIALELPGYHQFWNYAEKKGYSGTAVFTREEPLHVVPQPPIVSISTLPATIPALLTNTFFLFDIIPSSFPVNLKYSIISIALSGTLTILIY